MINYIIIAAVSAAVIAAIAVTVKSAGKCSCGCGSCTKKGCEDRKDDTCK